MDRLKGKTAVVTGAAVGIGAAIARRMAEEGAAVALTDVRAEEGLALAEDLRRAGHQAGFWTLDVAREAEVQRVIGEIAQRFGGLHILVNNAGVAGANKPTHELTEAEWDFVQAINVKGVFFCTKHAIPHLRQAGSGSIINLSSIYGLISAPDVPPYHASKGAVRLMSKTDALLYAPDRIRVNSVHPGFIWTPMVEGFLQGQGDVDAGREAVAALHPLGHLGEPDDIAWACVYLASEESKFVTGTEVVVDGGYTAR
ncbi:glucose 1-dehydrogenase [Phenylobacterium sp. J426]|uniref:SDR family NAD(P)-dependent oxidoreductase n=1 Tax=Phenylobacterium sp. J426 TaxID=2898439 RepID=UPI0021511C59|nr:glucose 1-dehydrogenase [Phenylobacterium sp. J426]MCR5875522.1 glucose 1-dehydrogenase [Phenylobacterium sp. J426]